MEHKIKRIKFEDKELICPECSTPMTLYETWLSHLKMGLWHKYGCGYCGGIFEVKRGIY